MEKHLSRFAYLYAMWAAVFGQCSAYYLDQRFNVLTHLSVAFDLNVNWGVVQPYAPNFLALVVILGLIVFGMAARLRAFVLMPIILSAANISVLADMPDFLPGVLVPYLEKTNINIVAFSVIGGVLLVDSANLWRVRDRRVLTLLVSIVSIGLVNIDIAIFFSNFPSMLTTWIYLGVTMLAAFYGISWNLGRGEGEAEKAFVLEVKASTADGLAAKVDALTKRNEELVQERDLFKVQRNHYAQGVERLNSEKVGVQGHLDEARAVGERLMKELAEFRKLAATLMPPAPVTTPAPSVPGAPPVAPVQDRQAA